MQYIIILFLIFTCQIVNADTTISGNSIIGSGFGTKQTAAPFKYDDFEDGNKTGVFDRGDENAVVIDSVLRGGSNYSLQIPHTSTGGIGVSSSNSTDGYYSSFWAKVPSTIEWGALSQIKHVRIYTDDDAFPYPNWTLTKFGVANGKSFSTSVENAEAGGYIGYGDLYEDDEWHRIETWFKPSADLSGSDGVIMVWLDGELVWNETDAVTTSNGYNTYNGIWTIFSYYVDGSGPVYLDDIYYDYTQSRVEVGNNAVFAYCTHREIQLSTAWSDTEITVTWNQGSFADYEKCWLHVINSEGEVVGTIEGYFLDGTFYATGTGPQAQYTTLSNVTLRGLIKYVRRKL